MKKRLLALPLILCILAITTVYADDFTWTDAVFSRWYDLKPGQSKPVALGWYNFTVYSGNYVIYNLSPNFVTLYVRFWHGWAQSVMQYEGPGPKPVLSGYGEAVAWFQDAFVSSINTTYPDTRQDPPLGPNKYLYETIKRSYVNSTYYDKNYYYQYASVQYFELIPPRHDYAYFTGQVTNPNATAPQSAQVYVASLTSEFYSYSGTGGGSSKIPTKLSLIAVNTGGDNINVIARLTDNNGNPLFNKTIYFNRSIDNVHWIRLGNATTDPLGYAIIRDKGNYTIYYTAWFPGDSLFLPSSATTTYYVGPVKYTVSIAVLNQAEATNFTASIQGSYMDYVQGRPVWRPYMASLHSLYNSSFSVTARIINATMLTTSIQGYITDKLVDYMPKQTLTPRSGYVTAGYGKYLTGPYLVKFHLWIVPAPTYGFPWFNYYGRTTSGQWPRLPVALTNVGYDYYGKSFQYLNNQQPYILAYTFSNAQIEWWIYNASQTSLVFDHWQVVYYDGLGKHVLNITDPTLSFPAPPGIDPNMGITITAYFVAKTGNPTITINVGTMYLPGEGIATPWLENTSGWSWNGTWTLSVMELYRVNEHIAMVLTDGSNVKVIDLTNGTSIKVYLPSGWKNNKYVKAMGQVKITQIPNDKNTLTSMFPSVTINGQTWYLVALAAWNPYKQFSGGYDTSCWLANGTTLAVYNLTYTYTFKNGTRVVFKELVVVSSLKVAVSPRYGYVNLKQSLLLQITVKWKYLPPAKTGIQPNPPSSIIGVAVIGTRVYNGTLIDANATSKTFLVKITDDTWTLYSKGVNSIVASAYWLSSMGTPEGPVAQQDPAQLNIVYVMPHIDSISEGQSLMATISILDVRTNQPYSANIYIELRDNRAYSVVATYGPYYVPGQATVTIDMPNTKQYVLAIYALPIPQKDKLVVPIPAVYPPRA
ncbi:hypothetical protein [Thermofilum sp.]|uniref:hypothetical protein n=1 Tax=Thermofilum sp. TaxID=1961369 RepID=UPI00316AF83B